MVKDNKKTVAKVSVKLITSDYIYKLQNMYLFTCQKKMTEQSDAFD